MEAGEPTYYKGELITKSNYVKITSDIRKQVYSPPKNETEQSKYGIFGINFFSDGSAEIEFLGYEGEEDEE